MEDRTTTEPEVPFDVPADSGRIRERYAIDAGDAMRALAEIDEAKLAREKRGEKMRFLSPSQLPVGINLFKILPPWTTAPPHAGRFWRAVWVHFGLGAVGETKTALCARRMNKLGLPKRKGDDALGPCAVCEALDELWGIPYDQRTTEQKKSLSDYRPRLSYLFNVVWLKGGGKSHAEEGTYVFTCSPSLGEPILTAFKFVLSMKPADVPDNFDIQVKKLPAEGKQFGGKQVYDYTEVFPQMPMVELDLDDPKYERYMLDAIYRAKEPGDVETLFRRTPCGRELLGGEAASSREPTRHRTDEPPPAAEEPPFRHGPAELPPSAADLSPEEEEMLAALASRARGRGAPSEEPQAMRASRRY